MGQYGLGLKDALAVLHRENCKVVLKSHGKEIQFNKTGPGGLVLGFEGEGPLKIEGEPHEEAGMLCYRVSQDASTSAVHTWVYTITATDDGPSQKDMVSAVSAVKKYLQLPDRPLYEDETVAIFKHNCTDKKPPRYQLGDRPYNVGGVHIGARFVDFPSPSQFTYFGYHFKKQTMKIRDGISRDQKLLKYITDKKSPLREPLEKVWSTAAAWDILEKHMPKTEEWEFKGLLASVPCLKTHFQAQNLAAKALHLPQVSTSTTAASSAASSSPKNTPAAQPFATRVVKDWLKHTGDLARHRDPARFELLKKLNTIVQETFPEDFAQLVPYGSTIYEVCVHGSDVDATLMVQSTEEPEQTCEKRLKALSDRLKQDGFNVQDKTGQRHPILVVQKDNTKGIPFDVDISFAGSSEIHKSHEVKRQFEKVKDNHAFELGRLVKHWAAKCKLSSKMGFLSSHAWMLLIILYTTSYQRQPNFSVLGFFNWFIKEFPAESTWELGKDHEAIQFEPDNPAGHVCLENRERTHDAVCSAITDLKKGQLPWASAETHDSARSK